MNASVVIPMDVQRLCTLYFIGDYIEDIFIGDPLKYELGQEQCIVPILKCIVCGPRHPLGGDIFCFHQMFDVLAFARYYSQRECELLLDNLWFDRNREQEMGFSNRKRIIQALDTWNWDPLKAANWFSKQTKLD